MRPSGRPSRRGARPRTPCGVSRLRWRWGGGRQARVSLGLLAALLLCAPGTLFGGAISPLVEIPSDGFRAPASEQVCWFLLDMLGSRVGWVRQAAVSDSDRVRTRVETHLQALRSGVPVTVEQRASWIERVDGEPIALSCRNKTSDVDITIEVAVADSALFITTTGGGAVVRRTVARPSDLRFPYGAAALHGLKGRGAGDTYSYSVFDLDLEGIDHLTVTVEDVENRLVDGAERRLVRTAVTSEQYAGLVMRQWRDESGRLWREEIPSLGFVRERVPAPPSGGSAFDLDLVAASRIACGTVLPERWEIGRAVYELWIDDGDVGAIVPEDARQVVTGDTPRGLLLEVVRLVPEADTEPLGAARPDLSEYLSVGPIVRSDAPEILEAARLAAGDAVDDWDRARAIERWVRDAVTEKGFGAAFATATEVLETGRGDCTEHTVLAIALARALGIPARAVSGVVHQDGAFLHHMWLEVWAGDGWYALDPTEGRGSVDATHIKLGTSALAGGGAAELNVAVAAALNRLRVAVVETERDESGGASW